MTFTVDDVQDLRRLPEAHPEWRAELRRRLTDEPPALPALVRDLAQAQPHTEAIVARLVEAQQRAEARLARLQDDQPHTEARLERLETTVAQLAEAQPHTETQLADRVGELRGDLLELRDRDRDRGGSSFGRYLRHARARACQDVEDARAPQLSAEELDDVLLLDLLVAGRPRRVPDAPEVWPAVEVSADVDAGDIARAGLLARAGRHDRARGGTGAGAARAWPRSAAARCSTTMRRWRPAPTAPMGRREPRAPRPPTQRRVAPAVPRRVPPESAGVYAAADRADRRSLPSCGGPVMPPTRCRVRTSAASRRTHNTRGR